jgi:hypothetical protein
MVRRMLDLDAVSATSLAGETRQAQGMVANLQHLVSEIAVPTLTYSPPSTRLGSGTVRDYDAAVTVGR